MELRVYTNKECIPKGIRLVVSNNAEFDELSGMAINDDLIGRKVISEIEGGEYISEVSFKSKFGGDVVKSIDLSTGSKTALNVYNSYGKDVCINLSECGKNAIQFILDNLYGYVLLPLGARVTIKDRNVDYYVNDVKVLSNKEFREAIVDAKSKRF